MNELLQGSLVSQQPIAALSPHTQAVSRQYTLLMADTPQEKSKWVIALTELLKLLRKCSLPDKRAFFVKVVVKLGYSHSWHYALQELFDTRTLPSIKSITCACIVDKDRLVVGEF